MRRAAMLLAALGLLALAAVLMSVSEKKYDKPYCWPTPREPEQCG